MKMKSIIILSSLVLALNSFAQTDQVRFRRCISGCVDNEASDSPNGNFNYGLVTDWLQYETVDVVSDYSMRNCTQCTQWHKGVDYSSVAHGIGNADRGDAILAIEGGIISKLHQGSGNYIYLIINGVHDYGYGHMFYSSTIGANNYLQSGKFIIKKCNGNNSDKLAIIDLERCKAYSDVNNATVTVSGLTKCPNNQTTFTTTNLVVAGDEIGPIGDSGTPDPHLHLYNMKGNGTAIEASNISSPLENVLHSIPHYNMGVRTENNENGITLSYPATTPQTIKVRAAMANAIESGDRFLNVSMNINEVRLEIKKSFETTYNPIIGGSSESKINLGAIDAAEIYPSTVSERWGYWGITGQRPYAYTEGNNEAYDDFYFADFITRIHKNDILNKPPLELADTPLNSRYNDGSYNLKPIVTNVHDELFTESATNITIDNFQPFITDFKVKEFSSIVRFHLTRKQDEGSTLPNNGRITISKPINNLPFVSTVNTYQMEVQTSEPLQSMTMSEQIGNNPFGNPISMTKVGTSGLVWTIDFQCNSTGVKRYQFVGVDLSGNQLMNVSSITGNNATGRTAQIPTRNSPTTWANENMPVSLEHKGQDFLTLTFECQRKISGIQQERTSSTRSNSAMCTTLENITEKITPASIGCGHILALENVDPGFNIGWKDENGVYILGGITKTITQPGIYEYIIEPKTNDDCCTKEGSFIINELNDFSANITSDVQNSCGSNGSITLTTTENYSYKWSHGPTAKNISNLAPGTYDVELTNQNGCKNILLYQVESESSFTLSNEGYEIIEGQPCHRRTGGKLKISEEDFVQGGTGPFKYYEIRNDVRYQQLNIDQNIEVLDDLLIEVEDVLGCKARMTLQMPYGDLPRIAGLSNSIVCESNDPNNPSKNDSEINFENPSSSLTIEEAYNVIVEVNNAAISDVAVVGNIVYVSGPQGEYTLTLTNKLFPACNAKYKWEKKTSSDAEFSPLQRNIVKSDECGYISGSFTVSTTGGIGSVLIQYHKVEKNIGHPIMRINNNEKINVETGQYKIMISDECTGYFEEMITIGGKMDAKIIPYMNDCKGKGAASHLLAVCEGGSSPYTYKWSNGVNTPMTIFPKTKQSVTITDSRGCFITETSESEYYLGVSDNVSIIASTPSCPLSSDGTVTLSIRNPGLELVQILNKDNIIHKSSANPVLYTISNLPPDEDFGIGIKIGSCDPISQKIRVTSKVLTENHKSIKKIGDGAYLCTYDVLCDGIIIFSDLTHSVQPTKTPGPFIRGCPALIYKCGDHSRLEALDSRWMRGVEYKGLLEAQNLTSNFGIVDCSTYKVCDDGTKVVGVGQGINLGCGDATVIPNGSLPEGCLQYKCECFDDYLIFINGILNLFYDRQPSRFLVCGGRIPKRDKNLLDLNKSSCTTASIKKIRGSDLTRNLQYWLSDPKFLGSSLKDFYENNSKKEEFNCTEIYYCQTGKYEFITSNIESVICNTPIYCFDCTNKYFNCQFLYYDNKPIGQYCNDQWVNIRTFKPQPIDSFPLAICRDTTINLNENGEIILIPSMISESIDSAFSYSLSKSIFDCSNIGFNAVILTVLNLRGDIDSCKGFILIEDGANLGYSPLTLKANNDTTICSGSSVLLRATSNGSMSWRNGTIGATTNVTPLTTTSYFVESTLGCSTAEDTVVITVVPQPFIAMPPSLWTIACNSDSIVSPFITFGGQGLSIDTVRGLPPGINYNIKGNKIVLSGACKKSGNYTYTIVPKYTGSCPIPPMIGYIKIGSVINAPSYMCPGGESALLSSNDEVNAINQWSFIGSGAYIFEGNNSNKYLEAYSEGEGIIKYTNSHGCVDTQEVYVGKPPSTSLDYYSSSYSACLNLPYRSSPITVIGSVISVNNLPPGISYTIEGSKLYLIGQPTEIGNYYIYIEVAGCYENISEGAWFSVVLPPVINLDLGPDQQVCAGVPTTLTANTDWGSYDYLWSTGETTQSITINPTSPSKYSVSVSYLGGGCSTTDEINIDLKSSPTADISIFENSGIINDGKLECKEDLVRLIASSDNSAATFAWSSGETTQEILVNPSETTSFTVSVTIPGFECPAVVTKEVMVEKSKGSLRAIDASGSVTYGHLTICRPQNISLVATGGQSYLWSNGSTSSSISFFQDQFSPSFYTVTISYGLGCPADVLTQTINISNFILPTFTFEPDRSLCAGELITITPNSTEDIRSIQWITTNSDVTKSLIYQGYVGGPNNKMQVFANITNHDGCKQSRGWVYDYYTCNGISSINESSTGSLASETIVTESLNIKALNFDLSKNNHKYFIKKEDGTVMKQGTYTNTNTEIDLKALKEGLYYIQLFDGDKEYKSTFVKKKILLNSTSKK
jgi:hypothetical protein